MTFLFTSKTQLGILNSINPKRHIFDCKIQKSSQILKYTYIFMRKIYLLPFVPLTDLLTVLTMPKAQSKMLMLLFLVVALLFCLLCLLCLLVCRGRSVGKVNIVATF